MNKQIVLSVSVLLAFCAGVAPSATPTRQLGALEIVPFDVPQGILLPADFRVALSNNLVLRLRESGKFATVFETSRASAETRPALRLTGVITEFKEGSQAKRYLLGPGFGKTILRAHIQFVDIETSKVVFEKDVDGKVIIGVIGGDSKGATNGLTKEVAKDAKRKL